MAQAELADIVKRERAVPERYSRAVAESDEVSEHACTKALETLRPQGAAATKRIATIENGPSRHRTRPGRPRATKFLTATTASPRRFGGRLDQHGTLLEINQLLRENFAPDRAHAVEVLARSRLRD